VAPAATVVVVVVVAVVEGIDVAMGKGVIIGIGA
jgi:hypothetical protein